MTLGGVIQPEAGLKVAGYGAWQIFFVLY